MREGGFRVYNAIMELRFEQNLNLGHFEQMEALEAACYGREYIAPAEEAYAWYRAHPHSVVALLMGDQVLGFANVLPVRQELFAAIVAGEFNDAGMTTSDILSLDGIRQEPFELFLSCIVVTPAWRGKGLARQLLREALRPYLCGGLACEHVVVDNVTDAGVRLSESLGFRFVCESDHGTKIYRHDFEGFVTVVVGEKGFLNAVS